MARRRTARSSVRSNVRRSARRTRRFVSRRGRRATSGISGLGTGVSTDNGIMRTGCHYIDKNFGGITGSLIIGGQSPLSWMSSYVTGGLGISWPGQGTGINNRTGDRIKVLGFLVEGVFYIGSNLNDASQAFANSNGSSAGLNNAPLISANIGGTDQIYKQIRLMAFKTWDPALGLQTTPASAFEGKLDGGNSDYTLAWPLPSSDFTITADDKIGYSGYGGMGMRTYHIRKYFSMNQKIEFTAGSTVPYKGACGLYLVSNDGLGLTTNVDNDCKFAGKIRMYFTDA